MAAGRFLIERRDRNVDDILIESEGLTIGRLPGNELALNHRAVSDTNAGIKTIDGGYWLFDLSRSHGVVVNWALLERQAQIQNGDVLQVGPYVLRFSVEPDRLRITVEVGVGWAVGDSGEPAPVTASATSATGAHDALALEVFWEKRRREAGKIRDVTFLHPRAKNRLGRALACWAPTIDLRQPWRMGSIVWGSAIAVLFGLIVLAFWRRAYSPGDLASPHQVSNVVGLALAKGAAGGQCSSCHSPLRSMESQCVECHRVKTFGLAISAAHRQAGLDCASCHREHRGGEVLAGLTNEAVCIECHNGLKPMHESRRAGQILGAPHQDTRGYPVVNGVWKWKGLSATDWRVKGLPEYLASRPVAEQFHAAHRALSLPSTVASYRMECQECHGQELPKKADRPLALAGACGHCHATDTERAASIAGCVSCHPSHGSSREIRALVAGAGGDFRQLQQQVEARRAELALKTPVSHPPPEPRIGALTWAGWAGVLFIPALASLVLLSVRSTRRRSSLRAIAAKAGPAEAMEPVNAEGPAYPHPVIDPSLCIGCYACVNACPHDVLAIVNGVATPVALDQCMEDTSCMVECPTSPKACVVVNTAKKIPPRKVPRRNQSYMTDVAGIYIVGDVSGVPLIKNALNEGAQVIQYVVEDLRQEAAAEGIEYDVGIIGIGAAGFSAAVNAREAGLRYVAIEQNRLASTLRGYPAGKYVFFKPETVAVKGPVPLPGAGGRKEDLLRSWDDLAAGVEIHEMERCSAISRIPGGFEITTQGEGQQGRNVYRARRVILAVGNAGSPMKLGVPGENLTVPLGPEGKPVAKVKYSLSDPDDYIGRKCIVVGAGNSAIEAAVDLTGFERRGGQMTFTRTNEVTLVVRSDFKGDLKLGNKMNIYDCMDAGRIKVMFGTTIGEITEREVVLVAARGGEKTATLANDFIFALIGSERPTKFLQSLGIQIGGEDKRSR